MMAPSWTLGGHGRVALDRSVSVGMCRCIESTAASWPRRQRISPSCGREFQVRIVNTSWADCTELVGCHTVEAVRRFIRLISGCDLESCQQQALTVGAKHASGVRCPTGLYGPGSSRSTNLAVRCLLRKLCTDFLLCWIGRANNCLYSVRS